MDLCQLLLYDCDVKAVTCKASLQGANCCWDADAARIPGRGDCLLSSPEAEAGRQNHGGTGYIHSEAGRAGAVIALTGSMLKKKRLRMTRANQWLF